MCHSLQIAPRRGRPDGLLFRCCLSGLSGSRVHNDVTPSLAFVPRKRKKGRTKRNQRRYINPEQMRYSITRTMLVSTDTRESTRHRPGPTASVWHRLSGVLTKTASISVIYALESQTSIRDVLCRAIKRTNKSTCQRKKKNIRRDLKARASYSSETEHASMSYEDGRGAALV